MPRILVIMDEFQILFDSGTNRKVAERCANLAKKIVTEGRSYGVHLLMATQSTKIISTLTLDRGTIEQMRIRVGLKCGEDDTRYLFGDTHCSDAMKKMEGPRGTAVLNEDYTENNPNVGLRVAFCNDETKKYYLKQISEKFADSPLHDAGVRGLPHCADAGLSCCTVDRYCRYQHGHCAYGRKN